LNELDVLKALTEFGSIELF